MASSSTDQLARLRVAVRTHHLPTDLGEWLLAHFEDSTARKATRNAAIRAAAVQLEGACHARAQWIANELTALRVSPLYWTMSDEGDALRQCLVRALVNNDSEPLSARQVRRVIADLGQIAP